MKNLSRRSMLKHAAAVGAITAVPRAAVPQETEQPASVLSAQEVATLEAIVGRLIPSDENGPGAVEAGAVRYIDRGLGSAFASLRDAYAAGLTALEAYCSRLTGEGFPDLDPDTQDAILRDLEQNFADGFVPDSAGFFELVRDHTLQGTFGDPHYGGNRDFIGWEMLNYPGIRLAVAVDEQNMGADNELVRLSAYDLPMFDADTEPSGGDDDAG